MSASVAAPSGPPPSLALQQRQRQQRRVALVHVVHVHAQSQRMRHAHAAHAQHNLLLQAVIRIAAVQVIRQPAIPTGILVEIGVQQINRHHVPEAAPPCRSATRAPSPCGLPSQPSPAPALPCSSPPDSTAALLRSARPCGSRCCWKYPLRCISENATSGTPRSAAERSVSPASTPRPPE